MINLTSCRRADFGATEARGMADAAAFLDGEIKP
jgi:hypothetical protein